MVCFQGFYENKLDIYMIRFYNSHRCARAHLNIILGGNADEQCSRGKDWYCCCKQGLFPYDTF